MLRNLAKRCFGAEHTDPILEKHLRLLFPGSEGISDAFHLVENLSPELRSAHLNSLGMVMKLLHHWAFRDGLTGLYNFRAFTIQIEMMLEYILDSECEELGLALVFLDLTHFKIVNDTNGYDVGNLVLRRCSEVIEQSCRTKVGPKPDPVIISDVTGDRRDERDLIGIVPSDSSELPLRDFITRMPVGDSDGFSVRFGGDEMVVIMLTPHLESLMLRLQDKIDSAIVEFWSKNPGGYGKFRDGLARQYGRELTPYDEVHPRIGGCLITPTSLEVRCVLGGKVQPLNSTYIHKRDGKIDYVQTLLQRAAGASDYVKREEGSGR